MRIAQAETAREAYRAHVVVGKASQQRTRIVGFLEQRGGDWSIGEIAQALGMEKSTVSARVNELLYETQSVEARPKRRDRVSGVQVRPVKLPAKQLPLVLD